MSDLIQQGIVSLAALSALAIIVRRVVRFVRPAATSSGCAGCSRPACTEARMQKNEDGRTKEVIAC